jgi:hypothetical protein
VTVLAGGTVAGIVLPDPPPGAADPTAACIRCDSTAVYLAEDGIPVCAKCGARLKLELTEVAPG